MNFVGFYAMRTDIYSKAPSAVMGRFGGGLYRHRKKPVEPAALEAGDILLLVIWHCALFNVLALAPITP